MNTIGATSINSRPVEVGSDNAAMAKEYLRANGVVDSSLDHELFAKVASDIFAADLDLSQCYDHGQKYCPPLQELYAIHASLLHNVGPYYSSTDVPQLLALVAKQIFTEQVLSTIRTELVRAPSEGEASQCYSESTRHAFAMHRQIEPLFQEVSSIGTGKVLAFVRAADGRWALLDDAVTDARIPVLEILRQDNADKCGEKRYRVRQTTYSSGARTDGVRWDKASWAEEPNYWAAHIRSALLAGCARFNRDFEGRAQVVCTVVGGAAKGTSSHGTDIDTTATIVCSEADAAACLAGVISIFSEELGRLPFAIQKDANIWPQIYCSDSNRWLVVLDGKVSHEIDASREVGNEIHLELGKNEPHGVIVRGDSLTLKSNPEPGQSTTVVLDLAGNILRSRPYQPPRRNAVDAWILATI